MSWFSWERVRIDLTSDKRWRDRSSRCGSLVTWSVEGVECDRLRISILNLNRLMIHRRGCSSVWGLSTLWERYRSRFCRSESSWGCVCLGLISKRRCLRNIFGSRSDGLWKGGCLSELKWKSITIHVGGRSSEQLFSIWRGCAWLRQDRSRVWYLSKSQRFGYSLLSLFNSVWCNIWHTRHKSFGRDIHRNWQDIG